MDKIYQWNEGWSNPIVRLDINLVVAEIKVIEEAQGQITPELVVEQAKKKESVLHDYFDWNNKLAAEKWRLQQASMLLRRIEVRTVKDEGSKIIRAFEVISRGEGNVAYLSSDELTPQQNENVMKFLITDLIRIKHRLARFNGKATGAIRHIDQAIEMLQTDTEIPIVELQVPADKVSIG